MNPDSDNTAPDQPYLSAAELLDLFRSVREETATTAMPALEAENAGLRRFIMFMPPSQHPDEHLMHDRAQRKIEDGRGRRRMSKLGIILLSGLFLVVVAALVSLGIG